MTGPRDRDRLPRPALVVIVAIVVALAACTPAPSPSPTGATPTAAPTPAASADPSATPTASPGASAGAAACTAADLKISHGLVEGTAGSRNTELVLVAAIECALPAWPALGIRDGSGNALIGGVSEQPGEITVTPIASYTSEAQIANWCAFQPAFPLTLEVRLGAEAVVVEGGSFPDEGDMPPCTANETPILRGTAWTLVP